MTVYNYCTRCGDELNDSLKENYEQNHEGGPVLCQACIIEVFKGIPKAVQSGAKAFGEAFTEAFEPLMKYTEQTED